MYARKWTLQRLLFTFCRFCLAKSRAKVIYIIHICKHFSIFFILFVIFCMFFVDFDENLFLFLVIFAIFVTFLVFMPYTLPLPASLALPALLDSLATTKRKTSQKGSLSFCCQTRIRRSACACCNDCCFAALGNRTSSLSPSSEWTCRNECCFATLGDRHSSS